MDPVVVDTLHLMLGLLFAAALLHKLRDPERFRATLADHRLLPRPLVRLASAGVVAAEALTVALLAVPGWTVPGLVGAAALLLLYAGALAVNLVRGRTHLDCGCLGVAGREEISWWLVARNVVCAGLALVGTVPPSAREHAWVDGLTLVGATSVLVLAYVATDQLLANRAGFRRLRGIA